MLFYLIRHGDPDYSTDSLTPLGRRQAEAVARRLSVHGLDRIYSSPMGRARETAQPTAELLRLPIGIEEWSSEALAWNELTEIDENGKKHWIYERMTRPQTCEDEKNILTMDNWMDMPSVAGTTAKQGYDRIQAASDEFFARHGYVREGNLYRVQQANEDTIVFFCHFGLECVLLSHLLGISPMVLWHGTCAAPTSVTTLVTEERREGIAAFRMSAFGDISHLYVADQPPAFSARFCETYANTDQRHD